MLSELLKVDTVFLTLFGYRLSYIEFAGTTLYLASVWLIARRSLLTWPLGILSVLLYMALFWQIRLYADALEQLYYLGACAYGWWYWSSSEPSRRTIAEVSFSSGRMVVLWLLVTSMLSTALGLTLSRVHLWLPGLFPEPGSYPYLDALTTVMSLVAMWLMARKHIESWLYWIVVDLVGVWLYFVKDVRFVSLLYGILLLLAVRGLVGWIQARPARPHFDSWV